MVVPNLAEAGCSAMFAGLQQVLQPAGYQIMLAESQHRLEQEEKLLETLLASQYCRGDSAERRAQRYRAPLVKKRLYSGHGNGGDARRPD
ncbi:Uncharacterised protein [Raoultella planticola]|uniref:Uncharacterized protein n=1 Tax=Raoultella planticola TaxID=575 RepID=A0A485C418_RAOPL|nr:Uncharacterised protein [Raoultella planticola]